MKDFILLYKDFILAIFTSVATLAGAAIGALVVRHTESRRLRRQEIIAIYSNFFRVYTEYLADSSPQAQGRMIAALESARLVCSRDAEALFAQFEDSVIHAPRDLPPKAALVGKIRKQAVQDIAECSR